MLADPSVLSRRWLSPEAFYQERDNRTALEVSDLELYANRQVEIHVDPSAAASPTVQRIALLAANLMARWARRIRVVVPDVPLHADLVRSGAKSLWHRMEMEMRSADPFGLFTRELTVPRGLHLHGELPLRLLVGPWRDPSEAGLSPEDYAVHAGSWTALGRRGDARPWRCEIEATTAAAALAAALGVADVFKRAIRHPRQEWMGSMAWCTWSHGLSTASPDKIEIQELPVPDKLDLGRVLLAGVGAIGSALLYILAMQRLQGDLTLLDQDQVDASNLNRSPMFTALDAFLAALKTDVCARYIEGSGAEARTVAGSWHERGAEVASVPFDLWISLTNEGGAWAAVPLQLPPVVLHGTTTSGWGFAFGRHIPRVEDCTFCRLPRPTAEFRGPCAEGEIPASRNHSARASLPFLSAAAAALVAAEITKLGSEEVVQLPNLVSADLRIGLSAVIAATRFADLGCRGCRAAHLPAWEQAGGRGRYASLSMRSRSSAA
jgi:hypothetical protein